MKKGKEEEKGREGEVRGREWRRKEGEEMGRGGQIRTGGQDCYEMVKHK